MPMTVRRGRDRRARLRAIHGAGNKSPIDEHLPHSGRVTRDVAFVTQFLRQNVWPPRYAMQVSTDAIEARVKTVAAGMGAR